MANDPNRDLLPVKEDCYKTRQGPGERIDHQSLSKLSRCELEDKVHRLLDEQTHLKKLSNSQEEKIKRLGTKLLRLINDKRHGGKNPDQPKASEDLHLQYVELEHENYALKDKITVLRQQLANHSRHNIIRSPVRSNHTSPLMSVRQSAPQFQNEIAFQNGKKTSSADVQLQEAEAHIKLLNGEIKSLHNKIEYLQQDLEKNSLDNRKTKVTENIEFIRLQRSLKQQAIQISALQAQIKNSENSQKILKEELLKAHNENDEALQVIGVKQNEILNLCSKLEEKNLNRLEEDDLKQRINDLMLERDSLKERADLLMKTIEGKPEETENVKFLKTLLAQEKYKTKKLEEILGVKSVQCDNLSCSFRDSASFEKPNIAPLIEKKEEYCITSTNSNIPEDLLRKITYDTLEKKDGWTSPAFKLHPMECKSVQTDTINSGLLNARDSEITGETIERDSAEKIKMKLEVQHLREMLRSQTNRCEAQQAEISRLMVELKLNEDKCKLALQKLEKRLSIFENLEMQTRKENSNSTKKPSPFITPPASFRPNSISKAGPAADEVFHEEKIVSGKAKLTGSEAEKMPKQPLVSKEGNIANHPLDSNGFQSLAAANENPKTEAQNPEGKKRFVDQVFLESSDEDQPNKMPLKEISSHKEASENEDLDLIPPPKRQMSDGKEFKMLKSSKMNFAHTMKQSSSSISSELKHPSDINFQEKKEQSIKISVVWLDIDSNSSLWHNSMVKFLFVDFTFLDLRGESTETPESLPKPTNIGQKCEYNFVKEVEINENRKKILQSLMSKPDLDLIIFKVVSDGEDFDQLTDFECEDVGVAVVTVKQFLDKYNKGLFSIPVKNTEDTKEVIGTLAIGIEITPGAFNPRH